MGRSLVLAAALTALAAGVGAGVAIVFNNTAAGTPALNSADSAAPSPSSILANRIAANTTSLWSLTGALLSTRVRHPPPQGFDRSASASYFLDTKSGTSTPDTYWSP